MRAATELELERPLPCSPPAEGRLGLVYALGAYLAWGFIPLYFWLLRALPPVDVVAHRVAWSILFLGALLTVGREWGAVRTAFTSRRTMLSLAGSTVLIATNWLVFVWAVKQNQVLQASLGYFITPLVSILLGVTFLKERLRPVQAGSLLLAAVAVGVLTWGHGRLPWVAVALALSFAFYGLLRKTVRVGPLVGLSVETALLLPLAVAYILFSATTPVLPGKTIGMLALAGPITAIPLLLFAAGAKRLRLVTMGFLQYLSPTCQFVLALFVFGEPFLPVQQISFGLIWLALAVFTVESVLAYRRGPGSVAQVEDCVPMEV